MKNVDGLKFYFQKLIFDDLKEYGVSETKYAIAGGAVRDYLSNQEIKDFDIFTQDIETENQLLRFFDEKGTMISKSDQLANYTYKKQWFQVIRQKSFPISSDPTRLIESFDFTICGAMVRGDGGFECLPTFFQDTLCKHLRVITISFPLSSLQRMQKYIQKGYEACNGTLLELSKSIQTVDFNNPAANTLAFYPNTTPPIPRFMGVD
jgi:hypothetical protein